MSKNPKNRRYLIGPHDSMLWPGLPPGLLDGGASILREEAAGTRQVVAANGTRLPVDGTTAPEDAVRCTAIGIVLGEPVSGDPLFREAQLPKGWKIVPSQEDSRTTLIVDTKGNRRGFIWYKAASYDRVAYVRIETRYWAQGEYSDSKMRTVVYDRAEKRPIWTADWLTSPKSIGAGAAAWAAYEKAQQEQREAACRWLDESHPDWENPAAYWP